MGWNSPDPYYQPEAFGLTTVASIDYSSGCYEFDLRAVWRHEDGTLYTARDAGCSCPSPFEDYSRLDQLEVADVAALEAEAVAELRSDRKCVSLVEVRAFLAAVQA